MDRPLLIFSGQSNRPLAQAIAEALGLPLGKSTTLRFANDNLFVRYEESLRRGTSSSSSPLSPRCRTT